MAAARLRSLARSWRLQHLVGAEKAEAGLRLEQGSEAWSRKRTWRLWQHVRGLPAREASTAQLQQALAEVLQRLLPEPSSCLATASSRV